MIETLLKSILFGFGLYTLIILVGKLLISEPLKFKIEKFDNSACFLISIVGFIYLLVWLINQFIILRNDSQNTFIGPYWLIFWLQPSLLLTSQLLWFKKLRQIKLIRFMIAIALLISIERFVIYLTSIHRDYLPSRWSIPLDKTSIECLFNLGLFGLISIVFHLIITKLKIKNAD